MRTSRRGFLKTLGGVALFSIVPRHVLGNGYIAPSDQLTKGIIGTGGMGRGHVNYAGTRLVAVCDVDKNHLELGKKLVKEKIAAYHDFRDLILDPNVDIVHIATPPHWHGIMSVEAAKAGKDIWCEKPMTRTIGEGKRVMEAVQQYGRMFRLNTWFRFTDQFYGLGTPVQPLKKLVQSGLLGWPLKVTISAHTGFNWKFYRIEIQRPVQTQSHCSHIDNSSRTETILFVQGERLACLHTFYKVRNLRFGFGEIGKFPLPIGNIAYKIFIYITLRSGNIRRIRITEVPPPKDNLTTIVIRVGNGTPSTDSIRMLLRGINLHFNRTGIVFT